VSGAVRKRAVIRSTCVGSSIGRYIIAAWAPTDSASQVSAERSSRAQKPKSSTALIPAWMARMQQERQQEIRILRKLRAALSHPGVLDRVRARRAEPWARDLLLIAYRLGLTDDLR
jgi:hypothetical protein